MTKSFAPSPCYKAMVLLGTWLFAACAKEDAPAPLQPGSPTVADAAASPPLVTPRPLDGALPSPPPLPDAGPRPPTPDAAPCTVPDAAPRPPMPDAAPVGGDAGSADPLSGYPGGPYHILQCATVAQFTFKRSDDSTISFAEIRRMPGVKVIVALEVGLGQVSTIQMLNSIYDELTSMGAFMMATLVSTTITAENLKEFEAMTQWKGPALYGNRISGPNGITSVFPSAYVIHARTMQIQARVFSPLGETVRPAALSALANAP